MYCSHTIDKDGLRKLQETAEAIPKASQPKNMSQLLSFGGMVSYCYRFLLKTATVLSLPNELLHNGKKWCWSIQCTKAFDEGKSLTASEKILARYSGSLPLKFACFHTERPIAFVSRSLTSAECNSN